MVSANREMAVYCFDALIAHYNSEEAPPPAFDEGQHPLFVTWKKVVNGSEPRLRGCIGTLEARCLINGFKDYALTRSRIIGHLQTLPWILAREVWWEKRRVKSNKYMEKGKKKLQEKWKWILSFSRNNKPKSRRYFLVGLQSALRDRRFPPIQAKELPYLECTVSILTDYETANNYLDWEVGKHGLIIEFTDPDYNTRRSATYLPEVAAHEGWTKVEAIDSLMRKAGYSGVITESLRKRVRLTRYQSTLFTLRYNEYASYVKATRGAAPSIAGAKPSAH